MESAVLDSTIVSLIYTYATRDATASGILNTFSGKNMAKTPHPPRSLDALVQLIRERFPDMSPQFQIGARHLIDSPSEVPVQSMRSIAASAGVQPATMVRLAKSLGYGGWDELRQVFVRGLQQAPRRYTDHAQDVIKRRNGRSALSRHVEAQISNLQLLEELNADTLPQAAQLLQRAQHIHIAGFRASHAAAYSLHYLCRLFRNSVTLLKGEAGQLEMELRALERNDAVVIIGFAPYSQEGLRVAQAAEEHGCRILALCDSKLAPVARHAAATLLFPTETSGFFPSSSAAMTMVEALASQLLAKSGRQAMEALGIAEDQLHRSGAYISREAT